jgi:phosphate transport system permease protein
MKKKFRPAEFVIEQTIRIIAILSLAIITLIFIFVFRETLPIFSTSSPVASGVAIEEVQESYGDQPTDKPAAQVKKGVDAVEGIASLKNLTSREWQPVSERPKFGLVPLILGSLKITLIAILLAAPIGILAALFTSAFAPRWAQELMKPAIEILAGIPSVVIGFFALIVLASFFQNTFGYTYRLNAFVGGVALSLAVMPIIYTITEDALSRVPKVMTEASLALGASKWQTALFVILPAATPGVFAAVLLGIGRAFGETMIVLMATGNAAMLSYNLFEPVRSMTATIGAEMAEVVFGDTHYNVLFLIGSILFVFAFTLNAIAEVFVRQRLMKRFEGL